MRAWSPQAPSGEPRYRSAPCRPNQNYYKFKSSFQSNSFYNWTRQLGFQLTKSCFWKTVAASSDHTKSEVVWYIDYKCIEEKFNCSPNYRSNQSILEVIDLKLRDLEISTVIKKVKWFKMKIMRRQSSQPRGNKKVRSQLRRHRFDNLMNTLGSTFEIDESMWVVSYTCV